MSSIQKRVTRTGESWRVSYRHEGKQRVVTFASEDNARRWQRYLDELGHARATHLLEMDAEPTPERVRTVRTQVLKHIDGLTGVTDGTRKTYRSYADTGLGDMRDLPLASLTRDDISAWVNSLDDAGLAGKTIRNRHGLLSAALADAVRDGLIVDNLAHGTRIPRTDHESAEMVFLTPQEYAALEQAMTEHYRPLLVFLVGTGCRFGEVTALQVGDVDLRSRSAKIRRAWKHTGLSAREMGPTKSKRSNRTIRYGDQVAAAIEPLMAGRAPRDLLFVTPTGRTVTHSPFWRWHWSPAVRRFAGDQIGIRLEGGRRTEYTVTEGPGKRPRIHDLRHTFASWAIQNRIPLPVLQRQLGHESIVTTVDRYGHLGASDFDPLAAITDAALAGHAAIGS